MPGGTRSAAAGNFLLELGGVKCGFVRSVDGGTVKADVIREGRARGGFLKKRLGEVGVEPFALELGLGLDKSVYAWLAESWTGRQKARDGAIVLADHNFAAKQRREFRHAMIQEVGFPASDGSSKEAAFIAVKFSAKGVEVKKASGSVRATAGAKAKQWLPSNFRLEIDGLDCKRVSKVDALTIRCSPPVDFPDVHVTLLESSAQTWIDWHRTFVVEGNNADKQEKTGRLVLLAPNMKDVLGEIRFFGLGIYRLAPTKKEGAGEAVRRLVASLYCERMELALE